MEYAPDMALCTACLAGWLELRGKGVPLARGHQIARQPPQAAGPVLGRVFKVVVLVDARPRTDRRPVGGAGAAPSAAASGDRAPGQGPPHRRRRHPVAAAHRRPVARPAGAVRPLAERVHPLPALAAGRRLGPRSDGAAGGGRRARRPGLGLHFRDATVIRAHPSAAGANKGAATRPSAAARAGGGPSSTCGPSGAASR